MATLWAFIHTQTISELLRTSLWKQGFVHSFYYENDFHIKRFAQPRCRNEVQKQLRQGLLQIQSHFKISIELSNDRPMLRLVRLQV